MRRFDLPFLVLILVFAVAGLFPARQAFAQDNEEEMAFWLGVAKRYMTHGNFEQAAATYRRVLKTLPDHPDALAGLAEAHEKLQAGTQSQQQDLAFPRVDATPQLESEADLLAEYRRALTEEERRKIAHRLGEYHLAKAQEFERDEKRAMAMLHFRKARVLSPNNALVHYQIFKALVARKRMQEAISAANRFLGLQGYGALASEVRRRLLEVHLAVGDRCVKRSRWEDAADHFRKVLEIDGRSPQATRAVTKLALVHYTLASTFHAKGRYVDAARQVDGLLKLKDISPEVAEEIEGEYGRKIKRFAIGACWRAAKTQEKKDKSEALVFYRRVQQLSPWSNYGKGAKEAMVRLKRELNIADTVGAKKLYQEAAAQDIAPVPVPTNLPTQGGAMPETQPRVTAPRGPSPGTAPSPFFAPAPVTGTPDVVQGARPPVGGMQEQERQIP